MDNWFDEELKMIKIIPTLSDNELIEFMRGEIKVIDVMRSGMNEMLIRILERTNASV